MSTAKNLSTESIRNAVKKAAIQSPVTVYPAVLGMLAGGGAMVFELPLIAAAAAVLGLSLGAGNWLVNRFLRKDQLANRYVQKLHQRMQAEIVLKRQQLKDDLLALGCEQGAEQLNLLHGKFENLATVLSGRLNPTELTYTRYLGVAEQVYLGAMDNLTDVKLRLQSIAAIDIEALQSRLRQDPDDASLLARQKLYQETHIEVQLLLEKNEISLTKLDETSVRVSSIRTTENSDMDYEFALQELERLANGFERFKA